ncbi:MAG: AAA-like domain-containing protein [Proteobacteria bacterium]|nr:AAA-like domain-containing protein [Pseudomonadota bacterium]
MSGTQRKLSAGNGRSSTGSFFAVGGPVQSDRPCYILRKADEKLFNSLRENDYCYVLGPRQIGKSSLMAATARRLSDKDELVSVVDLTQVISQQAGTDPSRWFYGIAYRIVRDLRLRVDLQSWWKERGALTIQHRLFDFFWEIVLANTTRPVTVFFDEIEDTLGLPFAESFFSGLRACHNSRAAEPDFVRLRFVIIGVATPMQLCPNQAHAPFPVSRQIDLNDFSMTEACGLLPGLNLDAQSAARALERIRYWTGGHPYLTQKICRAVSRRKSGEDIDDTVDKIVNEQFLARNRAREEPNLAMIRRRLSTRRQDAAALTLYGKLCKGKTIAYDPRSRVQQTLTLAGLVRTNEQRQVVVRNRIYKHVFTPRWVNQLLPFDWKGLSKASVAGLLLLGVPLWYTQILPRPYIETLSAATEDYQLAMAAYNDLRSIPGYGETADRLLSGVLMRRSLRAASLPQALEADQGLRTLPNNSALADQLLAGFWDRQAQRAEKAEQRDEALLFRLYSLIDDRPYRRRQIAELIGTDYPVLAATIRPVSPLRQAIISDDGERVTTLSADGSLQVWDGRNGAAINPVATVLAAEEYVGLDREILVALEGRIRGVSLELVIDHPDPSALMVRVISPQGTSVILNSSAANRTSNILVFNTDSHRGLAGFDREEIRGGWQLHIEDHQKQAQGKLIGWRLRFAGFDQQAQAEMLPTPINLPQPRSTERTRIVPSASGRYAAAYSDSETLGGLVNIWDLHDGVQLSRPMRGAGLAPFAFADGDRLLLALDAAGENLLAWDINDGSLQMTIEALEHFAEAPVLDPSSKLMMVEDRDEQGLPLLRVFAMDQRSELARIPFAQKPRGLAIDPQQGRWLASSTGDRAVEVWNLAAEELVDEYLLDFPVDRLVVDRRGRWLAAIGADGSVDIRAVDGGTGQSLRTVISEPAALTFHPAEDAVLVLRQGAWQLIGLPAGEALSPPLSHAGGGASMAAVTAGGKLMTGSEGHALRLWNIPKTGSRSGRGSRYGSGDELTAVSVSHDGQWVAAGLPDGGIRIWEQIDDGVRSQHLYADSAFFAAVSALAFDPTSNLVATADLTGVIRLVDPAGGVSRLLGSQAGVVNHLLFSPDGLRLAAAGELGARLWFVDRIGESVPMGSEDPVSHLVFSPDGSLLAISPELGELSVWHAASGDPAGSIRPQGQVSVAAFNPDQAVLSTGSRDGTLQFWSLEDGSAVWPAVQLGGPVREMAYTDTGRSLVVISDGWAHLLTLPFSGPRVVQSRMLPERIPNHGFFLSDDDQLGLKYLDWVDGGLHRIRTLKMDSAELGGWPGDSGDMTAQWQELLNLDIDPEGQIRARGSVFDLAGSLDEQSES